MKRNSMSFLSATLPPSWTCTTEKTLGTRSKPRFLTANIAGTRFSKMASNGVISYRAGRGPSFILVGLVVIVVILFYSYWGVSSKNGKLLTDVSILQDRLRVLAARKLTADKKGSALLTHITQLQDEHDKVLNTKNTKISEIEEQLQRKESELETMRRQEEIYKRELEKLHDEINKTSGNFKLVKGKAAEVINKYKEMTKNYSVLQEKAAQLESEKQFCQKNLEAYKVEVQKLQLAFAAKKLITTVPEKPKEEDVDSNGKKIEDAQPTPMALPVRLPNSNGVVEEEGKNKEEREMEASPSKDLKLSVISSVKEAEQAAVNVSVANKSLVQSHENVLVSSLKTTEPETKSGKPETTDESSKGLTGTQEEVIKEEKRTGMLSERQQKAVDDFEDEQSDGDQESVNVPKPDEGEKGDQDDTDGAKEDEKQEDDKQEDKKQEDEKQEDEKREDEGQENEEDEEKDKEGDALDDFKTRTNIVDEKDKNIADEKETLFERKPGDSIKHEWIHNKDIQEQHPLKRPYHPESAMYRHGEPIDDDVFR